MLTLFLFLSLRGLLHIFNFFIASERNNTQRRNIARCYGFCLASELEKENVIVFMEKKKNFPAVRGRKPSCLLGNSTHFCYSFHWTSRLSCFRFKKALLCNHNKQSSWTVQATARISCNCTIICETFRSFINRTFELNYLACKYLMENYNKVVRISQRRKFLCDLFIW